MGSKLPEKTLILIRHAHRDTTVRSADNGLSERGRRQAQAVARHFDRMFHSEVTRGGSRVVVISSGKRRCVESVIPLARRANADIETSNLLAEKTDRESAHAFQERVREFIGWWRQEGPPVTVVCSHGDWLPACAQFLGCKNLEFAKGSWAEFAVVDGKPMLRWLLQSFTVKKKKE